MPIVDSRQATVHDLAGTRFTPLVAPSTGSTEISVWQVEIPPGGDPVPHQLTREEVPFSLTAVGDEPVVALAYLPVGGQATLPGQEPFTPPWAR